VGGATGEKSPPVSEAGMEDHADFHARGMVGNINNRRPRRCIADLEPEVAKPKPFSCALRWTNVLVFKGLAGGGGGVGLRRDGVIPPTRQSKRDAQVERPARRAELAYAATTAKFGLLCEPGQRPAQPPWARCQHTSC